MKSLSTIASSVHASTTLALDALYKQMKADGVDVIGFAAGEPDFPTPEHIKYAGLAAIVDNETKYTPASGTLALKKAVCKRLKEDMNLDYKPENVICSSGAKHCLYIALRTIINPGDEVIIPTPAWVTYNEIVKMVSGIPVTIETSEENNFKMTAEELENAITENTKCLMLNNPSNPTGMLYTKEELKQIADICVKHDIFIMADEIYYKLVYDGREFTSIASFGAAVKELTIIINGVSKSYAMTGWRLGYMVADKRVISVAAKYLSHSTGNPSNPAQAASVAALNGPQDTVEEMRKEFEKRRDYIYERINNIPGVSCLKPEGAFYAMMSIKDLIGKTIHGVVINNADDFGDILLKDGLVCIVPCTGFGTPEYLRWSYAASMESLKEGLDRLEKFLAE